MLHDLRAPVMAGPMPAIHGFFLTASQGVDRRDKPGHDGWAVRCEPHGGRA